MLSDKTGYKVSELYLKSRILENQRLISKPQYAKLLEFS